MVLVLVLVLVWVVVWLGGQVWFGLVLLERREREREKEGERGRREKRPAELSYFCLNGWLVV